MAKYWTFGLQTNEALIAPLLRNPGNLVNVKDVQKVLLKKQKFSELTILYQQHNMHVEGRFIESCHEKTRFMHMQKQRRRSISCLATAQLISTFIFAT